MPGSPPIIATGSMLMPDVVVSTTNASVRPSRRRSTTITSATSASATKSATPLTRQRSPSRSRLQPRRHVGRVARAEQRRGRARLAGRQLGQPSRDPDAEPVDGQRRVHRALNHPGTQRSSRFDAEDADVGPPELPSIARPSTPASASAFHCAAGSSSAASTLRHIAARSRSS